MQSDVIRRRRLSDEVLARLESMILSPDYEPGDQLPSERELMVRFGVGRPAVREALYSLQKMGLVEINSGERGRVTKPTPRVLLDGFAGAVRHLLLEPEGERQFQEARTFFEVGLVRDAALHATSEQIERFEAALQTNHRALGDFEAFERTDVEFHYILAKISGNPIFTAIHEAVVEWLTKQRSLSLRVPGADRLAYESHAKIFAAVAANDPDRAEQVMREHLKIVAEQYLRSRGRNGNGGST